MERLTKQQALEEKGKISIQDCYVAGTGGISMKKGIVEIDIPENCKKCFLRTESGWCRISKKDIFLYGVKGTKPDWCQIKEVKRKGEKRMKSDYENAVRRAEMKIGRRVTDFEVIEQQEEEIKMYRKTIERIREMPRQGIIDERRKCYARGEKAYFHKWAAGQVGIVKTIEGKEKLIEMKEVEVGIAELENGTVTTVYPKEIVFKEWE